MTTTLPILSASYLAELERGVDSPETLEAYTSNPEFPLDENRLISNTHLRFEEDLPELTCTVARAERAKTDITNAIQLYEFLHVVDTDNEEGRRPLSPLEASDRRLWAYLTHGPFFGYCRDRWPPGEQKQEKRPTFIRSHWFFERAKLRRNALSRLWWAAHLTRSPWDQDLNLEVLKCNDNFHFTRILLSNQDIYQGINERIFGNSLRIRICFLETLDRKKDEGVAMGTLAKELTKRVNLVCKHTSLGCLGSEFLLSHLDDMAERTLEFLRS